MMAKVLSWLLLVFVSEHINAIQEPPTHMYMHTNIHTTWNLMIY